MKEYWFSYLFQHPDEINKIDELREAHCEDNTFSICQFLVDEYGDFELNENNYVDYEPYIGKGTDFCVDSYQDYYLLCNLTLGGDYMLCRKATLRQNEWLNDD